MSGVVAGTMLRGMFEERLHGIINEVKERDNIVLFIDEAHSIIGAGAALGVSNDAANIFKSSLARGEIIRPAICPTVWPRFRSETTKAPKSCTAPIKTQPNKTHSKAGNHPQNTAMAGPTIGPVPAMLVKWWPKITSFRVGT